MKLETGSAGGGRFVVALGFCLPWAPMIKRFSYESLRSTPVVRELRPEHVAVIAVLVVLSVPFPAMWGFWLVRAVSARG